MAIDEARPKGVAGAEADALADRMLEALNAEAWDTTHAISFTSFRGYYYLWDKENELVQVKLDAYETIFRTTDLKGMAYIDGKRVTGEEERQAIQQAWEYFANDSFWLIAPYKIKDPGTEHYLVDIEGKEALMITYTSGGVTPGDSYLWLLEENGMPYAWKIWAQILPVGGLKFTWEDWKTFDTGAMIATRHDGIFAFEMRNVKAGKSIEEITESNPFKNFEQNLNEEL